MRLKLRPLTEGETAWLLLAPAVGLGLLLLVGPVLALFGLSVTDWEFGDRRAKFVGLGNYVRLAGDEVFRQAFANTCLYVLAVVSCTVGLGFVAAAAIARCGCFRALYSNILFLPVVTTLTAMSIVWESMLHPSLGLVNRLTTLMGFEPANWLRSPNLVLPTLIVIGVWSNLGFTTALFLAGFKGLPRELYDAAALDGVSRPLDRAWLLTLPLMAPVSVFVTFVTFERAFSVFDTVKVMTQGRPHGASEVLLHAIFVETFGYLRAGYGSAMTVVFLAIVGFVAFLQVRVADRRVHYQ